VLDAVDTGFGHLFEYERADRDWDVEIVRARAGPV